MNPLLKIIMVMLLMNNMVQAINFVDLPYGWKVIDGINTNEGSIYSATNTRQQVKQVDIMPLALGLRERCLVTQLSTNPTYSVNPPTYTWLWIVTNGLIGTNFGYITNTVTNAIGWYVSRGLVANLDWKIRALVPYYVDTNFVYDGTTNIVMLSFTGLLASLHLGDGTNFTHTPCWTNPISTNWVVNYTSYWPSTIGVATNINYTSDYRQAVNYAASWTATGGHVWVVSSNWASQVVQTTNVFISSTSGNQSDFMEFGFDNSIWGETPWRIYAEDLQERYKVLNALSMTAPALSATGFGKGISYIDQTNVNIAKNGALAYYTTQTVVSASETPSAYSYVNKDSDTDWDAGLIRQYGVWSISGISTQVNHAQPQACVKGKAVTVSGGDVSVFDSQGDSVTTNFTLIYSQENDLREFYTFIIGDSALPIPSWADTPSSNYASYKGYDTTAAGRKVIIPWNFQYCTNKYW